MGLYDSFITCSHTIISGSTGSGKSVLINNWLYLMIRDVPLNRFELWIVDPKRVDYMDYRPFSKQYETELNRIEWLLDYAVRTMEARYKYMNQNRLKEWTGPHIFILIDEFGQVLRSKSCVKSLDELLRLGRAARIHVIAANQSASRATGCPAHLRINFTCQVGLHCVDKIASRQAIGMAGCETLPLYGYCYCFTPKDVKPVLYKVDKVPEEEIRQVITNALRR